MVHPDFQYDTARLGEVLCEGRIDVTADEVARFRALLGYDPAPAGVVPAVPPSMGLTYGLRLGWEHRIFPPGAIRMGDDDVFGVPARVGDALLTRFRILQKFERKGRRFLQYEMRTTNQDGQMVCAVCFTAVVP